MFLPDGKMGECKYIINYLNSHKSNVLCHVRVEEQKAKKESESHGNTKRRWSDTGEGSPAKAGVTWTPEILLSGFKVDLTHSMLTWTLLQKPRSTRRLYLYLISTTSLKSPRKPNIHHFILILLQTSLTSPSLWIRSSPLSGAVMPQPRQCTGLCSLSILIICMLHQVMLCPSPSFSDNQLFWVKPPLSFLQFLGWHGFRRSSMEPCDICSNKHILGHPYP